MRMVQKALEWAEVWALIFPLVVLLKQRRYSPAIKIVALYVYLAFLINICIDLIGDFKEKWNFPPYLQTNSFLYNIHSIVRFSCFASFFLLLDQPSFKRVKKLLACLSLPATIIYFSFFEPFNNTEHISAYFLAAEAFLLLLYGMQYYIYHISYETETHPRSGEFWIVTGLSIYVVVNFFVFLFYIDVLNRDWELADKLWTIHNIAYIVFCIVLAKGFYVSRRT